MDSLEGAIGRMPDDLSHLARLALALNQQARFANTEFTILEIMTSGEYTEEFRLAPCFFSYSRMTMQENVVMTISRLYDSAKNACSIGLLLKELQANLPAVTEFAEAWMKDSYGELRDEKAHYHLKKSEEFYRPKDVESQRAIERWLEFGQKLPVRVELTIAEVVDLFSKRYSALQSKYRNIRNQRNKCYAHNDMEYFLDYEKLSDRFPVMLKDARELVDFAAECTAMVVGLLTGVVCASQESNSRDIGGLLNVLEYFRKREPQ